MGRFEVTIQNLIARTTKEFEFKNMVLDPKQLKMVIEGSKHLQTLKLKNCKIRPLEESFELDASIDYKLQILCISGTMCTLYTGPREVCPTRRVYEVLLSAMGKTSLVESLKYVRTNKSGLNSEILCDLLNINKFGVTIIIGETPLA